MPSSIRRFPDLNQSISHKDPEEIDCMRTRRLAAKLFRIVRPILAPRPPRHENIYIALDAVAWTAAMILARTDDRDTLGFFTLALRQNLDRVEVRSNDGYAATATDTAPPEE